MIFSDWPMNFIIFSPDQLMNFVVFEISAWSTTDFCYFFLFFSTNFALFFTTTNWTILRFTTRSTDNFRDPPPPSINWRISRFFLTTNRWISRFSSHLIEWQFLFLWRLTDELRIFFTQMTEEFWNIFLWPTQFNDFLQLADKFHNFFPNQLMNFVIRIWDFYLDFRYFFFATNQRILRFFPATNWRNLQFSAWWTDDFRDFPPLDKMANFAIFY